MKIEDIVITDKSIVLGVFSTEAYSKSRDLGCYPYYRFKEICSDWMQISSVIDMVKLASNAANQIIFVLDDVHFPINPEKSVTCAELLLICQNDRFFEKTIFVKGENVINFDKNLVLDNKNQIIQ
jgi:hypothetical protein